MILPTYVCRRAQGLINFGDDLNDTLIPNMFGVETLPADISFASFASIGSILHRFLKSFEPDIVLHANPIHIWGSGFMFDEDAATESFKTDMVFHAVRGKLTRSIVSDILGNEDMLSIPLGDPAILVSKYKPPNKKIHKLGLVPHFLDLDNEYVKDLCNKQDVLLIDPGNEVERVLQDISSCQAILSSSLHGLIIADSYCIPNMWVTFSDDARKGSRFGHSKRFDNEKSINFKFYDYYSTFGLENEIQPFDFREQTLPNDMPGFIKNNYKVRFQDVDRIQQGLISSFEKFATQAPSVDLFSNHYSLGLIAQQNKLFKELTETKTNLHNANIKYRGMSQQHDELRKKEASNTIARNKLIEEIALANKRLNEVTTQLSDAKIAHTDERTALLEKLAAESARFTIQLTNTQSQLAESLASHSSERTELLEKLTFATGQLGESITHLRNAENTNQRLTAQVLMLQKSNEQYQQKINRIINTWYGKFALKGYRILRRLKRMLRR